MKMKPETMDLVDRAIDQLQRLKNGKIRMSPNVSEHVEWSLSVMLEDVIDTIRIHSQKSGFSIDPKMLEEFFSEAV